MGHVVNAQVKKLVDNTIWWYNRHMKQLQLSNSTEHTFVDDEDYPILSRLTWYKSDTGYAITDTPVKHLKMHKLIIGPIVKGQVIDHIDRNKLNNQKVNLRIVSQKINASNSFKSDSAKHYYFCKKRGWIIDSKSLGVRYMLASDSAMADRIVTRLKLGFPKDIALKESINQTISISNWIPSGIVYDDYLRSIDAGESIHSMRRRISRRNPKTV